MLTFLATILDAFRGLCISRHDSKFIYIEMVTIARCLAPDVCLQLS